MKNSCDFELDILDCPCELFCPQGCDGCDNQVCTETTATPDVTKPSQPDTTTSPTTNAILILNTVNSANVPMIVDFEGQFIFLNIPVCYFQEISTRILPLNTVLGQRQSMVAVPLCMENFGILEMKDK